MKSAELETLAWLGVATPRLPSALYIRDKRAPLTLCPLASSVFSQGFLAALPPKRLRGFY